MSVKSKFQISRSLDERIKRIILGSNEHDSDFAQVSSAYILGFNYGNVTNCVGLTTNYQLHHAVFPVVGLVFFKTSPTDDDIISILKSIKEFSSSPNGLGSFKSDKNEHLFLIYNVDKDSKEVEKRIFNITKGKFVRRRRLRLKILDDPFCPRQVHEGSEDLFNLGDSDSLSSSDCDHVDHLIFFIHGVGGVCDVRFRSCVEVVADFRKMANNLLSQQSNPSSRASTPSNKHLQQHLKKGFFRKHSTESSTSRCSDVSETCKTNSQTRGRKVECLPVSWHSCTRRQTGMNEQLNLVALSSVPKIRHFLNKVVMDALLYTSGPVYCQTILNNVGDEINRLYTLFMEKHPNFNGSVSLAGHSLGSVIVFDLLANQIPSNVGEQSSRPPSSENTGNNNNNNNNNNEDESVNYASSKRKNCRNISHHHHDLTSTDISCCMTYKNLEELLKDMDLIQYKDLFHKEHIDINTLLLLTDLDMKELNLPLGARRKLGNYINFKKVSLLQMAVETKQENTQEKQPQEEEQERQQSSNSENKAKCNHIFNDNNTGQYLIKYPQLKFKPKCFFAFGSPMPMFLNIRGIQEISKEYKLPTCDRMLNIYHPYDPLAYRVEPLIDPRFKNVEPVLVPHHRGGKRMHVQIREGFARVGYDIKHRIFGSIRDTWTNFTGFNAPSEPSPSPTPSIDSVTTKRQKWATKSSSSSVDVLVESFDIHQPFADPIQNQKKLLKRQPTVTSQSDVSVPEPIEFDSSKVGQLNGGRRVDYVLQEKPIELFNEYVFAFISHANYWQNEDSALILLNEIYSEDNIQLFDNLD